MRRLEDCIWHEDVTDKVNGGVDYLEFSCVYPFLEKTYTWYERAPSDDNFFATQMWVNYNIMHDNPIIPIIAVVLYGILIVYGQNYFRNREPWNLRGTLAMWNLSLAIFSFIGAFRLVPQMFYLITYLPLRENICGDAEFYFGRGSGGLWVHFFVLSKFPELLDTFFIVVHKKPLIFLHWYHHVTVLLYCWTAYINEIPAGFIFAAMNFTVHSIMYFYYFLMAIKYKPKWFSAIFITLAQILQMVVGVLVTSLNFYYFVTDSSCSLKWQALLAGFVMYGSYLFLFLQFFLGKYSFVAGADKDNKLKFF